MRRLLVAVVVAAGTGLLASACSSGSGTSASSSGSASSPASSAPASSSPSSPSSPASPASQAAAAATVALGTIKGIPRKALVDGNGRTLYLFEADKSGTSTCSGACAAAWPPLVVSGTPHAGAGVNGAMLGTIHRSDGKTQVVYNGHPLYYFTGDSRVGSASGQGSKAFGAAWYVVGAGGKKIDTD